MTQVPNGKADMATMASANKGSPNGHRWQFSLRQMFVAITGVAIVFGIAAWGGWVKSDAVAYLSIAVLAGVFSRAARQALVGACVILIVIWLTGVLANMASGVLLVEGPSSEPPLVLVTFDDIHPYSRWLAAPILFFVAAFLRANSYIPLRALIFSLLLIELFIATVIVYSCHYQYFCDYQTLFRLLTSRNHHHRVDLQEFSLQGCLLNRLPGQLWYVAAPWLLGIVVGEIIMRRRKPSGGTRQEV